MLLGSSKSNLTCEAGCGLRFHGRIMVGSFSDRPRIGNDLSNFCQMLGGHTVDGRNPAPARAYLTIHYNLYPRTPFSMLCSEALCAGAGFQSFNFFVMGTFFL